MESLINSIPSYLLKVLLATLNQLFVLFGPSIFLAVIMHFISTGCQNLGYRLMGSRIFLGVFGWLGTAVHELGHALFALLFFHRITEIKLFSPDSKKGSLGYVSHTWNSSNLYQTVGNFFIGIGPILMGSIMLFLITFLLFFTSTTSMMHLPITIDSFGSTDSFLALVKEIWKGTGDYLYLVFISGDSSWWKIILFLYLVFAVGSSITLSPEDIKGALRGFLIFVLLILIFNLTTLWINDFATTFFRYISNFFSAFYFLLILSILLNLLFILTLFILTLLKQWVIRKSEE